MLEMDNVLEVSSSRELLWLPLAKFLGLSYGKKAAWMYYTSQAPDFILKLISARLRRLEGESSLCVGCLDTGILGDEKKISSENLEKDLKFAGDLGVDAVFVFRLSGIKDEEYNSVLEGFA
jgi:hypothetical protein